MLDINNEGNIVKLEKNIWVYKNLFNDVSKTVEYFVKNNEWSKWYTYGDQSHTNFIETTRFESFPTQIQWDSLVDKLTNSVNPIRNNRLASNYDLEIINIFYKTTKHYVDNHEVSALNWKIWSPMICRYYSDAGAGQNFAMAYHTDYQQERSDARGDKFVLTCNIYLNDNYDNGEIKFKIFYNENEQPKEIIYKPKAGDVIIFPSTPPYYHGVNKTYNGEKIFVRGFWFQEFEGTKEWLENEQKFGKEIWAKMEEERQQKEARSGKYIRNSIEDM